MTNRDLLVAILADPDFLAGRYVRLSSLVRAEAVDPLRPAAAALADAAGRRSGFPSGWRNVPAHPQQVTYAVDGREVAVAYRFRRDGVEIAVDGEPLTVALVSATPERVVLDVDGVRRGLRRPPDRRSGVRRRRRRIGHARARAALPRPERARGRRIAARPDARRGGAGGGRGRAIGSRPDSRWSCWRR